MGFYYQGYIMREESIEISLKNIDESDIELSKYIRSRLDEVIDCDGRNIPKQCSHGLMPGIIYKIIKGKNINDFVIFYRSRIFILPSTYID